MDTVGKHGLDRALTFCASPSLSRPPQVEKERLQGQVVNSPQRILREVANQQQALEQVRFLFLRAYSSVGVRAAGGNFATSDCWRCVVATCTARAHTQRVAWWGR